jgi:hypothetical protein
MGGVSVLAVLHQMVEDVMTRWSARDDEAPIRGYRRRGDDVNLAFLRVVAVSLIALGIWTMWLAARTI